MSPQKEDNAETTSYMLAQLGSSKYNLKDAVRLPPLEDRSEWIANNIVDFQKQICMLYGTIEEYCTPESCPKMSAGKKLEYLWSSGPQQEPIGCPAPEYINTLLDWVQEQLDDGDVFPSSTEGKQFPVYFEDVCKVIAKRLLRVYAHICHHHLSQVKALEEEAHMNTSLKHFIYFVQEFNLMTPQEFECLKEYIQNLT